LVTADDDLVSERFHRRPVQGRLRFHVIACGCRVEPCIQGTRCQSQSLAPWPPISIGFGIQVGDRLRAKECFVSWTILFLRSFWSPFFGPPLWKSAGRHPVVHRPLFPKLPITAAPCSPDRYPCSIWLLFAHSALFSGSDTGSGFCLPSGRLSSCNRGP